MTSDPTADAVSASEEVGRWNLGWLHRGDGGQVWLRVYPSDEGGDGEAAVVVRQRDSGAARTTPLCRRSHRGIVAFDAVLDLGDVLAEAADPVGTWDLLVGGGSAGASSEQPPAARIVTSTKPKQVGAVPLLTPDGPLAARFTASRSLLTMTVKACEAWAEIAHVDVSGDAVTVTGTIADRPGRGPGSSGVCVLYRRDDGQSVTRPVEPAGGGFRVRVPTDAFAPVEKSQTWDVWLRPGTSDLELRVGRHLDDVADKKEILRYPKTSAVPDRPRLHPYYTTSDNLSLRVTRASTKAKAAPSGTAPATKTPAAGSAPASKSRDGLSDRSKRRTGRVLAALEWASRRRRPPKARDEGRTTVHLMVFSAFGMGGTVRTVLNLAGYLASQGYEVHLISVFRPREKPFFPIDGRIHLEVLCDERELTAGTPPPGLGGKLRHLLHRRTSRLFHEEEGRFSRSSLWSDLRILRALWSVRSGILITSRAGLNIIGARYAHPAVTTVGQEHLTFGSYKPGILAEMGEHYRKLDALSVLSTADERAFRELLDGAGTRVERVPNAVADEPAPRADLSSRRIVAAGRLTPMKGFDLLIDAFAEVARRHPGWELRVFGAGRSEDKLRGRIIRHGLSERVLLMGTTARLPQEMAKASIYTLSSRFEPFGMVLTEAHSCGLPVVSFDCPHGPGEIVKPDVNGLLVSPEDVEGLAAGICRLIEDEGRRRRLSDGALKTVTAYSMDAVGTQWEALLAAARSSTGGRLTSLEHDVRPDHDAIVLQRPAGLLFTADGKHPGDLETGRFVRFHRLRHTSHVGVDAHERDLRLHPHELVNSLPQPGERLEVVALGVELEIRARLIDAVDELVEQAVEPVCLDAFGAHLPEALVAMRAEVARRQDGTHRAADDVHGDGRVLLAESVRVNVPLRVVGGRALQLLVDVRQRLERRDAPAVTRSAEALGVLPLVGADVEHAVDAVRVEYPRDVVRRQIAVPRLLDIPQRLAYLARTHDERGVGRERHHLATSRRHHRRHGAGRVRVFGDDPGAGLDLPRPDGGAPGQHDGARTQVRHV